MSSDWWDDFFNNMATDLAPLISLFGEQATKQFISESTSPLDCFILAMAPLGIITVIISAIRVGGNSSLRAFVGRAQEGSGSVEAELCSSTSRDVCELYNDGGIARVFGRPKILEFVQDLQAPDDDFATITDYLPDRESAGPHELDALGLDRTVGIHSFQQSLHGPVEEQRPSAGIYSFLDYVKRFDRYENRPPEWKELSYTKKINPNILRRLFRAFRSSRPMRAEEQQSDHVDRGNDQLAPHPNLSLNIGIKKRSPIWFILAAITGLFLQSGVLVFAGLTVSVLRETFDKDGKPVDSYAFPTTCVGTILVCVGVGLCAHIVERRTTERVFRRTVGASRNNTSQDNASQNHSSPEKTSASSRIFWVQPGIQVIGDQIFDSFAYGEPSKGFLSDYISSRKDPQDEKTRKTSMILVCVFAPITVLGFIFQFVGLRALHSTVSIAQLGAMIIMSIIRSSLRTERFRAEENRLGHDPDLYQGHELDWLSIELVKDQDLRESPDPPENLETKSVFIWQVRTYLGSQRLNGPLSPPQLSTKIFLSRARLARMTGSQSSQPRSQNNSIHWDEDLVTGRGIATKLVKALEDTIAILLRNQPTSDFQRHISPNDSILVPISCFTVEFSKRKGGKEWVQHNDPNEDRISNKETVSISLFRDKVNKDTWKVDISEIEALLGLWLWSFQTKVHLQLYEENEDDTSKRRANRRFGENLRYRRLLFIGKMDDIREERSFIKWLYTAFRKIGDFDYVRIRFPSKPEFDPACTWAAGPNTETSRTDHRPSTTDVPTFHPSYPHGLEQNRYCTRHEVFFGWHLLPSLKPTDYQAPLTGSTTPQGIAESVALKALTVPAAQNLAIAYVHEIFILVFKNFLNNIGGDIIASSNITKIVNSFTNSGLGSEYDALTCIIPTLYAEKKLPFPSLYFFKDQEWELKKLFDVKLHTWKTFLSRSCESSSGDSLESKAETQPAQELRFATKALCELYKASISTSQLVSVRKFGIKGLSLLIKQRDEIPCSSRVLEDYVEKVRTIPVGDAGLIYEQAVDEIRKVFPKKKKGQIKRIGFPARWKNLMLMYSPT